MQLINVLQCFSALFPVIKKLTFIAFNLIGVVPFAGDNLKGQSQLSGS
jgi:hypothetical protein